MKPEEMLERMARIAFWAEWDEFNDEERKSAKRSVQAALRELVETKHFRFEIGDLAIAITELEL